MPTGDFLAASLLATLEPMFARYRSLVPLYVLVGTAVLVCLFFVFVLTVSMTERQHLTGDVEPTSEPYPYPASAYWNATRADAFELCLTHAGDFATCRNKSKVKGLQSMFISPDHLVLVSIVTSSFGGLKLKKTVLRSRLQDGRVLESVDSPGTSDATGVIKREVLLNAGIAELLAPWTAPCGGRGSSSPV